MNKLLIQAVGPMFICALASTILFVLFIVSGPPLIWAAPLAALGAAGQWYVFYLDYKRYKLLVNKLRVAVEQLIANAEDKGLL